MTDRSHSRFFIPKSTFHNLAQEKQSRIVDAAIGEFAAVPFESASINRIVRASGISKGSFYQYFDDMLDLYRHAVIAEGAKRKFAMVNASGFDGQGGLFGQLKAMVVASLRFGLVEPRLLAASLSMRGPFGRNSPLRELHDEHLALVQGAIEATLMSGVQSGAVRPDVDLSAAAFLIVLAVGHGLEPMMRQQLGFGLHDVASQPTLADTVDDAALETVVDALLNVIIDGIRADPDAGTLNLDRLFSIHEGP